MTGVQTCALPISGLGEDAELRFELLTHDERPLPGWSGPDAAVVRTGGYQVPVTWRDGAELRELPARYKIKATFAGPRKEGIRFHALYLQ